MVHERRQKRVDPELRSMLFVWRHHPLVIVENNESFAVEQRPRGWDCYRHYEAPLAFSVPVISAPTIVRQFPLIHGEHCFYYFCDEPGSLANAVMRALDDRQRLRNMAEAARELVIARHLWPRRIQGLLRMTLKRKAAPGGLMLDKTS
ncbi:MAG TPA: glycosyltransferase [Xanthobacteraceae bacterium]|nr:glycosyltransferase [Xanthobacteraceae bacterium]